MLIESDGRVLLPGRTESRDFDVGTLGTITTADVARAVASDLQQDGVGFYESSVERRYASRICDVGDVS